MKNTLTRETVPEDFTLPLVLVDALPVVLFGGSMLLIAKRFGSTLFLLGALLCLWAGLAKVAWKLIVVLRKKNIWWLFMQMRIVMPIGFLLILLSVLVNAKIICFSSLLHAAISLPSVIFFCAGLAGMVLMGVFAAKLDSGSKRANWIEQFTNTAAQACIFLGLLLL